MGTPPQLPPTALPPGENRTPPQLNQMELLTFLGEQWEHNRTALREEAEGIRNMFITISRVVAWPVAVALAIGGWAFFHNLNEMRTEAQRETQSEINQMKNQIHQTLEDQFKTAKIKMTIEKAAQTATQGEVHGLIEQTVNQQIAHAITPYEKQVRESAGRVRIQELISRVDADDAHAFDELRTLQNQGPSSQQSLIAGVVADRTQYAHTNVYGGGDFRRCVDPKSPPISDQLGARDATTRKNAIISCTGWAQQFTGNPASGQPSPLEAIDQLTPILVRMASKDPSLSVRAQAVNGLNVFFASSPGFPSGGLSLVEPEGVNRWWLTNKQDYRALALLSAANDAAKRGVQTLDSSKIYDLLLPYSTYRSPGLARDFNKYLEQMRATATRLNKGPVNSDLLYREASSCDGIVDALTLHKRNSIELNGGYQFLDDDAEYKGFQALRYLNDKCSAVGPLVPEIANYAINAQRLSRRYAAITLLNKWTTSNLDPYDASATNRWWNAHKSAYAK